MPISDIQNPIKRFVAFIEEREAIRQRRASGKPWPWTEDMILQAYRFTNIHREDDAVSKNYQKVIREHYGEKNPYIFPATVLYRWFNRVTTCEAFFCELDFTKQTPFEHYIRTNNIEALQEILVKLPTPHVTGAFIIQGRTGHTKGDGVLQYFHAWCQKQWVQMWVDWLHTPPSLHMMDEWILGEGLGSFMRGQLVADLKYLPFMKNASDWWTWASPGPGSMKGLNIVLERPMDSPWPKGEWLFELQELNNLVTPMLNEIGIGRLHNQDLQNCLCELSKYEKVRLGMGRPRQIYRVA